MIWATWWVWVAGGLMIAVLEVFAPGYIFMGFALGAMATGGLLAISVLGASLPVLLLVFAGLSLLAWIGLRTVLGLRRGQIKRIDRDINEN